MPSKSDFDFGCPSQHPEVLALHAEGCLASHEGELRREIRCFSEATKMAANFGDEPGEFHNRVHWGSGLCSAGRLREALVVLAPALEDRERKVAAHEIVVALYVYARVALALPAKRLAIESAIRAIERLAPRTDGPALFERWARGLRAALAKQRHDYDRAASLLQECAAEDSDCHLLLAQLFANIGRVDLARGALCRWRNEATEVGVDMHVSADLVEASLALTERRPDEALQWAYRADSKVSIGERSQANYWIADACSLLGRFDEARERLGREVCDRRSESLFERRTFYMQFARYHTRIALSERATDSCGSEQLRSVAGSKRLANIAYGRAMEVARQISELLESDEAAHLEERRKKWIE